MKKKIKDRWIKALLSGKYKQAKGQLRVGEESEIKHCCLGVLCDLYINSKDGKNNKAKWEKYQEGNWFYSSNLDRASVILPGEVSQWAGLDETNPEVKGICLSDRNDGGIDECQRPQSFSKIAKVIENNL